MDPITSFGTWLTHRRHALDLTRAELAQRVGCAMLLLQLCGPGARFVNGVVVPVDGGFGAFSGV